VGMTLKARLRTGFKATCSTSLPNIGLAIICSAGFAMADSADLTSLSIEDLANVKVTSVSKKSETLSQSPGAVFVLTSEDIRRGGFSTLPEALRMVPGLYVVKINSHSWQVSARGFSDFNNNKMLVLVDGRTVYTPLSGGVFWDALDLPIENIERVEVIRGPGGTLWGANAMNGVINIVTKNAAATQGWMVSTSADFNVGYTSTVQYGGEIGPSLKFRLLGKSSYWEPLNSKSGSELPTNFNMSQAGLRVDWGASPKDDVTLELRSQQGSFRNYDYPTTVRATELLKGDNVQVHWKHKFSEQSETEILSYCDWYTREGVSGEMRNRCDIEFQHSLQFNSRHSLIWGAAYLTTGDNIPPESVSVVPQRRRDDLASGFAQYEFVIVPGRLRILGGSKIEHNSYSGFEFEPQVRSVWTPTKVQTVWSSLSRAVRSPNREENDLQTIVLAGIANNVPYYLQVLGNRSLQSEHLMAYEVGYRYQPRSTTSLDAALFYNSYSNLIVGSPVAPIPGTRLLGTGFINSAEAQTHGVEVSAKWRPIRKWTLSTAVSELRGSANAVASNPHHLFNVLSRIDFPHHFELDGGVYHYSAIPVQPGVAFSLPIAGVPTFNRVDIGVAWHASPQWTFSVWGRNLQADSHVESLPSIFAGDAAEIPRSVSFKILWRQRGEYARP